MCRSCADGGRRCPGETPAARRARQNAAYHRKVAAKNPASVPASVLPAGTENAPAGDTWAHPSHTPEGVAERIAKAQDLIDVGDPYTRTGPQGWLVPSEHGLETTRAIREAGQAVQDRAETFAADELATIGQDPQLPCQRPGGFRSRDEYQQHVEAVTAETDAELDRLSARKRELRIELRDLGDDDAARKADLTQRIQELVPSDELMQTAFEARKAAHSLAMGDSYWDKAEARIYARATREALAEQRPMGLTGGHLGTVHAATQKTALKRLETALDYYPTGWTDKEHFFQDEVRYTDGTTRIQPMPLIVTTTSGRAFYRRHHLAVDPSAETASGRRVKTVGSYLRVDTADEGALGPGVSTAMHEYGHRCEHVTPEVNNICQAFVAERTMNADGSRHELREYLRETSTGKLPQTLDDFKRKSQNLEVVRPDDFADQYIGKQNDAGHLHSEVFSMGMEGVFTGRFGGLRGRGNWKADPDHRNLILGVLATVK